MSSLPFVDREKEWGRIEETLECLTDPNRLLRNPILEFYGVGGIGKSTLLTGVARKCLESDTIWFAFVDFEEKVNGDKRWPHVVKEISNQLGLPEPVKERALRYHQSQKEWDGVAQGEFLEAMKALLQDRPVVLIFDTLERAAPSTLGWLEVTLRDLLDAGRLQVILASKRMITFENTREVTRKLRPHWLGPFLPGNTRQQLEELARPGREQEITDELLERIFDLTVGHPLANKVVFDAILDQGLDPRRDEDRDQLVDLLFERVIERWVLADVSREKQKKYTKILGLLAVPRQFNLTIMQILIGTFAPTYQLLGTAAHYRDLIDKIQTDTFLIEWNPKKHGYAIDGAVRRILSLWMQLQEGPKFEEITRTLAETYERWVEEVSGSDRVRYILERLYHMSNLPQQKARVSETLMEYFDRFFARENPDQQLQLLKALQGDYELKEAIGEQDFETMVQYVEQKSRR